MYTEVTVRFFTHTPLGAEQDLFRGGVFGRTAFDDGPGHIAFAGDDGMFSEWCERNPDHSINVARVLDGHGRMENRSRRSDPWRLSHLEDALYACAVLQTVAEEKLAELKFRRMDAAGPTLHLIDFYQPGLEHMLEAFPECIELLKSGVVEIKARCGHANLFGEDLVCMECEKTFPQIQGYNPVGNEGVVCMPCVAGGV